VTFVSIGLIGLGNIGGRIAKHLLQQGNDLVVYDVNVDVLKDFETLGARIATSPSALAEVSKYVITVLPNSQIVKKVVLGEHGLISSLKPGSVVIDMTTSVPNVTKEIGEVLKSKGIEMLDAPISGGIKKAGEGTLSIMVGGEDLTFNEVLPILSKIGTNIIHVGELGSGHTIKALNNLICASNLLINAEALAVGVKMGLDPQKMLQVINSSSGRSQTSEVKFPEQVLNGKFEVGFTIDLMCKDVSIAMDMAKDKNMPMFVSSSVSEMWEYAVAKGGGGMDHTAIVKFVEEMGDLQIRSNPISQNT
jgi:3-hydroxyisobutyrate dehydrogenase-like beta-hydroxyacid dehydrogenase